MAQTPIYMKQELRAEMKRRMLEQAAKKANAQELKQIGEMLDLMDAGDSPTVSLSPETIDYVESLAVLFRVHSEAEVIRRALALARVAADQMTADGKVTIYGKDKEGVTVSLVS